MLHAGSYYSLLVQLVVVILLKSAFCSAISDGLQNPTVVRPPLAPKLFLQWIVARPVHAGAYQFENISSELRDLATRKVKGELSLS